MEAPTRLHEKIYNRGMWLIAGVFAWALIGLGSNVVRDLGLVSPPVNIEQFTPPGKWDEAKKNLNEAIQDRRVANENLARLQIEHSAAKNNTRQEQDNFKNWVETRGVTGRADKDTELIERNKKIESLRQVERDALSAVEDAKRLSLESEQKFDAATRSLDQMRQDATPVFQKAVWAQELKTFGVRLLFTVPILNLAAFLYLKARKSNAWPFVYGYIIFAGFIFFVELVPYLPSYGGYIRYLVMLLVTFFAGRHAMAALRRYMEKLKQAEQASEKERRKSMSYEKAQRSLSKSVCPGCDRPVNLTPPDVNYCEHCGLSLFNVCECGCRSSSFSPFCKRCGVTKLKTLNDESDTQGEPS